ncbi:hypothetical protein SESBI_03612 [Sesbania bispinosa]|nr:hypothetical protein SESBI_03612 [Sesbania bispinosa]
MGTVRWGGATLNSVGEEGGWSKVCVVLTTGEEEGGSGGGRRRTILAAATSSAENGTLKTLEARPCPCLKIQRTRAPAFVVNKVVSSPMSVIAGGESVRFRLDNLGPQPGSRKKAKRKGRGISARVSTFGAVLDMVTDRSFSIP